MDQGTSSVSDGAGAVSDTTPSTGTSACASDGLLPDGQLAVQDVTSLPAESADVSGGVSADAGVPAGSADLSGGVLAIKSFYGKSRQELFDKPRPKRQCRIPTRFQ